MKLIVSIIFLCFCFSVHANQGIKGKISSESGEPLAFATIYVKGSTNGTNSNAEGLFQLNLDPGKYIIVFRYVGFNTLEKEVEIKESLWENLNIQLKNSAIDLAEVVARAGDNKGLEYMKKAIKLKNQYKKEPYEYQCLAYTKGTQKITKMPKTFMGQDLKEAAKSLGLESDNSGIIYLSETLAEIKFRYPNNYNERIIKSKVSGDSKGVSFNRAQDLIMNPYEDFLLKGLKERGFVSPFHDNAPFYYDFELTQSFYEGSLLIHKIAIKPKRSIDPCFFGHVYLVDESWRIHSVSLNLDKRAEIEFVDSIRLKQSYAPLDDGSWVIVSNHLDFYVSIWGFELAGYFLSNHKNYSYAGKKPEKKLEIKKAERLYVEKDALENDSMFWDSIRPIPLTFSEKRDYFKKDSIESIVESPQYKDSVEKRNNKLNIINLLNTSYTFKSWRNNYEFTVNSLISSIQENSIEGIVFDIPISYSKTFLNKKRLSAIPNIRFGLGSKRFYYKLNAVYTPSPFKISSFSIDAGRFIKQFNEDNPIDYQINTVMYFAGVNLLKAYEASYLKLTWNKEWFNGLKINPSVEWTQRSSLNNNDSIPLFRKNKIGRYSSNNPINPEYDRDIFPLHQALIFNIELSYVFGQKYVLLPNKKQILTNDRPLLKLNYKKAIKTDFTLVQYDFVKASFESPLNFRIFGNGIFKINGGLFINSNNLTFADYHHFLGNRSYALGERLDQFMVLDYYIHQSNGENLIVSSKKSFTDIHYEHNLGGFVLNKIPLIRKLGWNEVFRINYLYQPDFKNYWEWSVGISRIGIPKILPGFFRIDFARGYFPNQSKRNSVLISSVIRLN